MKSKVNFKPLHGRVLLELPTIKETTETGIIKSEEMLREEKSKIDNFIKVAAVNESIQDIKVGDKVLVEVNELKSIEIDGINYGLAHVSSIIGVRND